RPTTRSASSTRWWSGLSGPPSSFAPARSRPTPPPRSSRTPPPWPPRRRPSWTGSRGRRSTSHRPARTRCCRAMAYPDHLREQVDAYLAELRFHSRVPATDRLEEAMRYSLLAGGKRIRPVLALASASAVGHRPEAVLPLAA